MIMPATCKKIFSPIKIPEKGILGAKFDFFFFFFFFSKNVENGNNILKRSK